VLVASWTVEEVHGSYYSKIGRNFYPVRLSSMSERDAMCGAGTNGRPIVFFDITFGDIPVGRIKMELFSDIVPRCATSSEWRLMPEQRKISGNCAQASTGMWYLEARLITG